MNNLLHESATSLARRIARRELSSEELTRACLARIAAVNPAINAVVQLRADAAIAEARAADVLLARGQVPGALHGVPFTAKDVFETAGVISAAGMPERAAFVPAHDAVVVARMKAAGAILLGKTNCPPGGGGGESDNPVYGRTNNPYDFARTSGGSSGGEAAIIAACGSPIGLGSDSGGSIRTPAHFCGVAGLKPTWGRVPNTGTLNHPGGLSDPRSQIGVIARHAEDLDLAIRLIAGPDWRDSSVVPVPFGNRADVDLAALRLAFYTDDDILTPLPEVAAAVHASIDALHSSGVAITEDRPAPIPRSFELTKRYWSSSSMDGEQVEQLYDDWTAYRTDMLAFIERYDAIICPVSAVTAPPHGEMTSERFSYTLPWSLTGWPCVTMRVSTSSEALPIGVQIVARPWCEHVALAIARLLEQTLGGWQPSPLLP